MSENALAKAYHDRVATQTVLIRRFFKDEAGNDIVSHGTGVIIAHETISKYKGLHIATAGHVLDGFGEGKSMWEVSRIEKDEAGRCTEVRQTFRDKGTWSSYPRIISCKYLRDCDIGLIAVENRVDGDEHRLMIDPAKFPQLKVAPMAGYLHPGARVAWAGFPGFVADMTGAFNMCYFEGIVSAVPPNPPVYLVDGHSAPGVSGGPLWILQADGEPIIIGVCIDYRWPDPTRPLPGLVGFCPLIVLLNYVREFCSQPANHDKAEK